MNFAYWMLIVAALLPYAAFAIAQRGGKSAFDNREPRLAFQRLEGIPRRAYAAHINAFECFAPFAAGVLAAGQAGVGHGFVSWMAGLWVLFRIGHLWAYVQDIAPARTAFFTLASLCSVALIVAAATH